MLISLVTILQKKDQKMIDNEWSMVIYYEAPQGETRKTGSKLFEKLFEASKKVLDKRFPLWYSNQAVTHPGAASVYLVN